MSELKWYFPDKIEEAHKLIQNPKVQIHGGGTSLLRLGVKRLEGLVDLNHLGLSYFKKKNTEIELGASLTYSKLLDNLAKDKEESILYKALAEALPSTLRSQITVGGSIAASPIWSDFIGPLLALDASIVLYDGKEKELPLEKYLNISGSNKNTIIKGVKVKDAFRKNFYHRETRTKFDYSTFNLSISIQTKTATIEDIKIIFVGTKEKWTRCSNIEKACLGKKIKEISPEILAGRLEIEFADKSLGSSEYLKHLAKVNLARGLSIILNGEK